MTERNADVMVSVTAAVSKVWWQNRQYTLHQESLGQVPGIVTPYRSGLSSQDWFLCRDDGASTPMTQSRTQKAAKVIH
jgi:hypothetical protein